MPARKSKRTLVTGFSLSIILLVISSIASYKSISELTASLAWVQHTDEVEQNLSTVVSLMKDVETGQRGYLLTGRDRFLEPYQSGKDSVWHYFDHALFLTADNHQQQLTFDTLSNLIKAKLLLVSETIEIKKGGHEVPVDSLEHGKIIMDSIRLVIKTMIAREGSLMVTRTGRFNQFSKYTPTVLVVSSLLALIIAILFYQRIRSDYQRRLALEQELIDKDAAMQKRIAKIDSIAQEIAKGNYDIRIDKDDLA